MAVHALELDLLAVEDDRVAHDLHFLEAHAARADVVAGLHHEGVEVGILGRPQAHVRHVELVGERAHGAELGVVERGGDLRVAAAHRRLQVQRRVAVVGREGLRDVEVVEAHLGRREERHVAVDARVAEHVLVLKVGAVAPAVDFHCELVLAVLEVLRDVELARELGVLGVAHLLSVHPHVVGGVDAVEADEHVAPGPALGHGERAAVGRDGVVVGLLRVAVEDARPLVRVGVAHVHVAGRAEPAHLHAARHVDREPGARGRP